jgi:RND family efflux transporter MFP subunit
MHLHFSLRQAAATALLLTWPGLATADYLDCVIEPKAIIDLVVSEKGRISEILVSRGAIVTEGQVLVRLEDDLQQLQMEMAELRMNSDLEVRAGETRLQQRQKDLERAQLLADRNVGAVSDVELAEIELELTKLTIEQARQSQALLQIEFEQARAMLSRRTVLSPVDGLVMSVEIAPGAFASEQLKIMAIAVMDPLHVEVFAPAIYNNRIAVGDVFQVRQGSSLTGVFSASVIVVDKVFDSASGTFGVQLAINNEDGSIPAGTRCQIDLELD